MPQVTDETAFKLLWLAQWKLQQESKHMEPKLTRMIGHLSVYQKVAQYMEDHDVEDAIFGKEDQSDIPDEFSELLTYDLNRPSAQPEESSAAPGSVVVTEVELDGEGEKNPFSDDEEVSSRGEDDIEWSSDDETEFGSVSSFEEDDIGDIDGRHTLDQEKGDVDMDPILGPKNCEVDLSPNFE